MSELTDKIKINILEALIGEIERDHPEYQEENTTGWDMIENGKLMLEELKSKISVPVDDGLCRCASPRFTFDSPMACENCNGKNC